MTILQMLGQSGVLTILGMGVVFAFLVILVICVTLMGKVFNAFSKTGTNAALEASPQTGENANAGRVAAVIAAALSEYRKNN